MGKTISDICVRTETCDTNENLVREFQQKALTFPFRDRNNGGQNFSMVPKSTSSKDYEWLASRTTSNSPNSYEKHSSCSFTDYRQYPSLELLLYHANIENVDGEVEKSIFQFCTKVSSQDELEKSESIGCSISQEDSELDESPVIKADVSSSNEDSLIEFPILERIRSNAIELQPVKAPGGKFLSEQQFYIQNANCEWEIVSIESWNPWNGTWQVMGEDGISFPAAPIALKTKEEYEFLSRERVFRTRSFGSLSEI